MQSSETETACWVREREGVSQIMTDHSVEVGLYDIGRMPVKVKTDFNLLIFETALRIQ